MTIIFGCQHTIRKPICVENPYSIDCGCVRFMDIDYTEKNFDLKRLEDLLYCDHLFYARPVNGIKESLERIYKSRPSEE